MKLKSVKYIFKTGPRNVADRLSGNIQGIAQISKTGVIQNCNRIDIVRVLEPMYFVHVTIVGNKYSLSRCNMSDSLQNFWSRGNPIHIELYAYSFNNSCKINSPNKFAQKPAKRYVWRCSKSSHSTFCFVLDFVKYKCSYHRWLFSPSSLTKLNQARIQAPTWIHPSASGA